MSPTLHNSDKARREQKNMHKIEKPTCKRELPGLDIDSSSDEEQFDQQMEDTKPYPYPKYNDEVDVKAHVRAFLMTWQDNHVSQKLSEADANKSKIAEFGLALEG